MSIDSVLVWPKTILFAAVLIALPTFGSDSQMQVTDNGSLDVNGFSVILYENTYHPIFVDEKNAALQIVLHGRRIVPNGEVHLMPAPEQPL
jgi:hypothetical protein